MFLLTFIEAGASNETYFSVSYQSGFFGIKREFYGNFGNGQS